MTAQGDVAASVPIHSRPVSHWPNVVWWVILLTAVLGILIAADYVGGQPIPAPRSGPASYEREGFLALVFGTIGETRELAIPADSFRTQMAALKQAGYSTVGLAQVHRWQQHRLARLPGKPVLLTFEEAHKETMEIADEVLAALGMRGVVFVNVRRLNQRNLHMVSWHQLKWLVKSGRWEVGVSGCVDGTVDASASPGALAQRYAQERELLEQRLGQRVLAADCPRAWNDNRERAAETWTQALKTASLSIGFVTAPAGANYRDDTVFRLRRIRVSKEWSVSDLLSQLAVHAPRRKSFVDDFRTAQPASDWVIDSAEVAIEDAALRISSKNGQRGGLVTLGGTNGWQDAHVEVQVRGKPKGQFWIFLRYRTHEPFIRLGLALGRVMLQESDRTGRISQLANRESPSVDVALALRVVGSRVVAYVNGQTLLTRPAKVPAEPDRGAFALAVWDGDESGNPTADANGEASVYLTQVKVTPVSQKCAIVAQTAGSAAWTTLRHEVDVLSSISPRYFTWAAGKPQESHGRDPSVEIFAHHHRLKLLPTLVIDEHTQLSEAPEIADQALQWAADPAYHGLNVILITSGAETRWDAFFADLNVRMAGAGKELVVTTFAAPELRLPEMENDDLLLVEPRTNASWRPL